jgi:hypothetical protein
VDEHAGSQGFVTGEDIRVDGGLLAGLAVALPVIPVPRP